MLPNQPHFWSRDSFFFPLMISYFLFTFLSFFFSFPSSFWFSLFQRTCFSIHPTVEKQIQSNQCQSQSIAKSNAQEQTRSTDQPPPLLRFLWWPNSKSVQQETSLHTQPLRSLRVAKHTSVCSESLAAQSSLLLLHESPPTTPLEKSISAGEAGERGSCAWIDEEERIIRRKLIKKKKNNVKLKKMDEEENISILFFKKVSWNIF